MRGCGWRGKDKGEWRQFGRGKTMVVHEVSLCGKPCNGIQLKSSVRFR